MSYRDRGGSDCRIFVGNLPPDIREKDITDIFYKYGTVVKIDLKNKPGLGPPFAFVEFEDSRDARDAISGRNGYDYDNYQLRVEFPRGPGRSGGGGGGRGGYSGGGRPSFGGGGGGGRPKGPPPRRSEYRCLVTGLPPSGSWQDLKDHMRAAGDVCFTDVFKDGTGVVEFLRREDMEYAIKNLDDTKFKSHENETSYIRVKQDEPSYGGGGRSRSRSYSPPRRGGGGRGSSPYYSSYKRSRSRSWSRKRSRSRSSSR